MFYSQIFAMYKIVNIKCIATAEIKKLHTSIYAISLNWDYYFLQTGERNITDNIKPNPART